MSSADLATVVIACPHCGTRYQVPWGTLGKAGREVQCAQCGKPWHAMADESVMAAPPPPPPPPVVVPKPPAPKPQLVPSDPDAMFSPADEAELDRAFEAEAVAETVPPKPTASEPGYTKTLADIRSVLAPKPKPATVTSIDPALLRKAKTAFDRRQKQVTKALPLARVRRTARLGAFVALIAVLVLGYSLRVDLVRWFPSLAGLYAAIGMPVNVVGLVFEDSKTITALRDGKTVMKISAKVRSITNLPVAVPPVLVSLLNDGGLAVYEWTVAPALTELEPGEIMDFSTEVNSPPSGATRVRLTFTTRNGGSAQDAAKAL